MKLSKKQILHVAKLANLKLSKKEVIKFQKQLSEVIECFEELKEVNTSSIEPTSQTTGLNNVSRKDEIQHKDSLSQKEALSGTEEVHNGYFKVPAILLKE
jgi:aspartyl-tRNA(Asn)/glutamyl-tRNA(Gln) amidotransferase subunit C